MQTDIKKHKKNRSDIISLRFCAMLSFFRIKRAGIFNALVVEGGSGADNRACFQFNAQMFFGECCGFQNGEVGISFAAPRAPVFTDSAKRAGGHFVGQAPLVYG